MAAGTLVRAFASGIGATGDLQQPFGPEVRAGVVAAQQP